MAKILTNAFSINMIAHLADIKVRVEQIKYSEIPPESESQIGHADIAGILSLMLGRPILVNHASSKLELGDELYVAQYIGPCLPEGAVNLPLGAKISFYKVTLEA